MIGKIKLQLFSFRCWYLSLLNICLHCGYRFGAYDVEAKINGGKLDGKTFSHPVCQDCFDETFNAVLDSDIEFEAVFDSGVRVKR